MDAASASQADLGDCDGKVHDRSHLVVLSFLDSGLFAAGARFASDANRSAHCVNLCHIRSRERCRRLAFIEFDSSGILRECGAKMGDVPLLSVCLADCRCLPAVRVVVHHILDRACCRRPSRIFRQPFHSDLRPLPSAGSRFRCGDCRHGRSDWRNADRRNRRPRAAMDRQLHGSFFYCSLSLSARVVVYSPTEPQARSRTIGTNVKLCTSMPFNWPARMPSLPVPAEALVPPLLSRWRRPAQTWVATGAIQTRGFPATRFPRPGAKRSISLEIWRTQTRVAGCSKKPSRSLAPSIFW